MVCLHIDDETELRTFDIQDTEELYALIDANREHLRRWMGWIDTITSVKDIRSFIWHSQARQSQNNGFNAGIFYQGKIVGVIGFHFIDHEDHKTEIGYWLAASAQGKGLMTRACRTMVDYAFQELRLNRVEIQVATGNARSRAIPERLGFTQEGVLRDDAWLRDHFVDHVVYGMLAREWKR
ncbi:MAG TPA: GNAT family protein [Ktedonobacteraceae bacterium]|nr:GNAT family protein [Ktedonobacteraceae bacterium]